MIKVSLICAILLFSSISPNACAADTDFAAASIRPSDPQSTGYRPRMGPMEFYRRATLKDLICLAYTLEKLQIVGGPKWLDTQLYDVEAKTASPAAPSEILQMLRSLLRDRFNLQVHTESQTMPVYALVVADRRDTLRDAAAETPRDGIGAIQVGDADVAGHGVTMHLLAHYLTLEVNRLVLDQTGLDGHYDFTISFGDVKPPDGSPETFGALAYAIKHLGLKLQSKRAPVPVLIIDNAVPPSAN
jgi:uncharacterized protein (TIGR03435 family)